MTRTVNGERLFGAADKEVLRKMLWRVADFSGVEVVTYCLMSNHFHVLVRVTRGKVDDAELMRRYRVLYPKPRPHAAARAEVLERTLARGGEEAEALRARLLARMGDVSEFMKTLKQRFSVWFNKNHARFGTLWSERFKSVWVEGRGHALRTMAAYIDLNPVRAGLADDPKDYRFCGYGEAVGGSKRAEAGLRQAVGEREPMAAYRMALFGAAASPRHGDAWMQPEKVRGELEKRGGRLPLATALRCRARYFSDGVALGSAAFVRDVASGPAAGGRRKGRCPVRPMEGADWGDLAILGRLRGQVFG